MSTTNDGTKIGATAGIVSVASIDFQPITATLAPGATPASRRASATVAKPERSMPIRLKVGQQTTSTGIGTTDA